MLNKNTFAIAVMCILAALVFIAGLADDASSNKDDISEYNKALNIRAVSEAKSYLAGDDIQLARYAIMGLSNNNSAETIGFFRDIWEGSSQISTKKYLKDPGVLVLTAKALIEFGIGGAQEYRDYIYRMIASQDRDVRIYSIMALGALGDKDAVMHLYDIAYSDDTVLARNAISEMLMIVEANKTGADEAYDSLFLMNENKGTLDPVVQRKISDVYSKISNQGRNAHIENDFDKVKALFMSGDYDNAKSSMLKFARNGNSEAQFYMGEIYSKGINKDYQRAEDWYVKSAEQGYVLAEFSLGNLFLSGSYKNYQKAIYWFERAAEHGDKNSQNLLSRAYLKGWWGLRIDKEKSNYWATKANKQ